MEGVQSLPVWKQLCRLPSQGHVKSVTSLVLSSDGTHVFSTGDDQTTKKWNRHTGQVVLEFIGHSDSVWACGLALVNGNEVLVTGSRDGTAKRWDTKTGLCEGTFVGHSGQDPGVRCLDLTSNGRFLVTGSRDFSLRKWDLSNQTTVAELRGHDGIVWSVKCSLDERWIFSGSADKTVKMWSFSKGTLLKTFDHPDFVWSVAISRDSSRLFTGCKDCKAREWDISENQVVQSFEGHTDTVRWVGLNEDCSRLLTAGYDVTAREWDVKTGKILQTITAHAKAVLYCVAGQGRLWTTSADAKMMQFLPAPKIQSKNKSEEEIRPDTPSSKWLYKPKLFSTRSLFSSRSVFSNKSLDVDLEDPAEKEKDLEELLTEKAFAGYTNISLVPIALVLLTILVQTLQVASFAFRIDFIQGSWLGQAKDTLSSLSGNIASLETAFDVVIDFRFIFYAAVGWSALVSVLFFSSIYKHIQNRKVWLNKHGLGQTSKSRYKGNNPLEKGDRSAENKAEWQAWTQTSWRFAAWHRLGQAVWLLLFLAVTVLAIPTVGVLVSAFSEAAADRPVMIPLGLLFIVLYCLVFLHLRLVGGDVSRVQGLKGFLWFNPYGAILANPPPADLLGPFTVDDWHAEFTTTFLSIGFSVINNVELAATARPIINVVLALFLGFSLLRFSPFAHNAVSGMLFALQVFQIWTMSFALAVYALEDPDNATPAIVWLTGILPVAFLAYKSYFRLAKKEPKASGLVIKASD